VVGTHRLLQRDVEFRNLGLVIIDEEQRFGVLQKERFKELRVAVDVLSLSATPIRARCTWRLPASATSPSSRRLPRSASPSRPTSPAREDSLVREVLTRELARGGQVFFVHNRVQSIDREAQRLRDLVPEARVAVAHGQMHEDLLASVMRAFRRGRGRRARLHHHHRVGAGHPQRNTIVIDDAHRLGWPALPAERAGRTRRAARLRLPPLPPERTLSERADKRLDVIGELQDLGAGFKLAMRDLEIRGPATCLARSSTARSRPSASRCTTGSWSRLSARSRAGRWRSCRLRSRSRCPRPRSCPRLHRGGAARLRCYQDLAACVTEPELERRARGSPTASDDATEAEALVFSLRVRLLAVAAGAQAVETWRGEAGPRLAPGIAGARAVSGRVGAVIQLPSGHGQDLEVVARQFRAYVETSPTRVYCLPSARAVARRGVEDVLLRVLRSLAG